MGLLQRLLKRNTQSGHPSSHTLASIFGAGSTSYTGRSVTLHESMTLSSVYSAIRLLSWSTAMLPLITYRREGSGKARAVDEPIYGLLKDQANPEMTAFEFRSTLMAHVVATGNAYAEIEWSESGVPVALWPLNPARMVVKREAGGALRYRYTLPDGGEASLPSWRVHHVRGLASDGVVGYSPVKLAMQAIGLGLATEEFGARFFGNGARPGIVLKYPGELSDEAQARIVKSWNAESGGLGNSHRVKILEDGLDLQTVGVPPEEAQFLDTRKFQVTEVARWFNVPPHMIADMSGATFSNIEEQGVEFVTYSLGPWLVNVEQALTRDLLTDEQRKSLFVEHLVDGLMRGKTSERYASYSSALQAGWMSPNEVRAMENLNPFEGGDTYLTPLNMVPAGEEQSQRQDQEQSQGFKKKITRSKSSIAAQRRRTIEAYLPVYEDVAERMVRREVQDIERALDKFTRRRTVTEFVVWLDEYYDDFKSVLVKAFAPVMLSLSGVISASVAEELGDVEQVGEDDLSTFMDEYLDDFASGQTASGRKQIRGLLEEEPPEDEPDKQAFVVEKVKNRLQDWSLKKARKIATKQVFRAGNGLALTSYVTKGVRKISWRTSGDACPFCAKLDGKVIDAKEFFIKSGESLTGGQDDTPMLMRSNVRHGPIHSGCDCTVLAETSTSDDGRAPRPTPSGDSAGTRAAEKMAGLRKGSTHDQEISILEGKANSKLAEADLFRREIEKVGRGEFPDWVKEDFREQYAADLQVDLDKVVEEQKELLTSLFELTGKRDKERKRLQGEIDGLLGGGEYQIEALVHPGVDKKKVEQATSWLNRFITSEKMEQGEVSFSVKALPSGSRAFYRHAERSVYVSPEDDVSIYIHEMIHALDHRNQHLLDASHKYLAKRATGHQMEPLTNYNPGYGMLETTIADHFISPYMGRTPEPGGSTEIMTMGVQLMYENPVSFAEQDPDMFAFIYDQYRGK